MIGDAHVHSLPDLVARKWCTRALDATWIVEITYLADSLGWYRWSG